MSRYIDWLISGVCVAMILMAQYRLVFLAQFDAFSLAAGIALILGVRSLHDRLPRIIAAKRSKPSRRKP
jgi:hypothetical protein